MFEYITYSFCGWLRPWEDIRLSSWSAYCDTMLAWCNNKYIESVLTDNHHKCEALEHEWRLMRRATQWLTRRQGSPLAQCQARASVLGTFDRNKMINPFFFLPACCSCCCCHRRRRFCCCCFLCLLACLLFDAVVVVFADRRIEQTLSSVGLSCTDTTGARTCTDVPAHARARERTHTRAHTHTHTRARTHTHNTHTHTHTHTHTSRMQAYIYIIHVHTHTVHTNTRTRAPLLEVH